MLGTAVDLIMVRDFISTFSQGIAPEEIEHLRDSIDVHLEDLMKSARKAARDAFQLKPKKLEKRVTKSVRRDLAPPDEGNGTSDLHE